MVINSDHILCRHEKSFMSAALHGGIFGYANGKPCNKNVLPNQPRFLGQKTAIFHMEINCSLQKLEFKCLIYYNIWLLTSTVLVNNSLLTGTPLKKTRLSFFFSIEGDATTQRRKPALRGMASQHLQTFEREVYQKKKKLKQGTSQ